MVVSYYSPTIISLLHGCFLEWLFLIGSTAENESCATATYEIGIHTHSLHFVDIASLCIRRTYAATVLDFLYSLVRWEYWAAGRAMDSECAKREEFKRQFLADLPNRVDRSALMRASATGRIQTVRALLKRRVAVNKKDAIGISALMLAAEAGHVEVVKALLAAGADPNAVGAIAHGPVFSVMTMAMNRKNKNRMEVIDMLIAGGARMNPPEGFPVAPLIFAIEGCDVVTVTALLKRGADVNWNRGQPLVAAVTNGNPEAEVVKVLLAAGADPNLPRFDVGGDEMTLLSIWSGKRGGRGTLVGSEMVIKRK